MMFVELFKLATLPALQHRVSDRDIAIETAGALAMGVLSMPAPVRIARPPSTAVTDAPCREAAPPEPAFCPPFAVGARRYARRRSWPPRLAECDPAPAYGLRFELSKPVIAAVAGPAVVGWSWPSGRIAG
jgi:hypothetical protein